MVLLFQARELQGRQRGYISMRDRVEAKDLQRAGRIGLVRVVAGRGGSHPRRKQKGHKLQNAGRNEEQDNF